VVAWQRRELERWCPALRVVGYSGSEAERAAIRDDVRAAHREQGRHEIEVVLTSYALFCTAPRLTLTSPTPPLYGPTKRLTLTSYALFWCMAPPNVGTARRATALRMRPMSTRRLSRPSRRVAAASSTENARRERSWLAKVVRDGYLVLDEANQIKNAESARYNQAAPTCDARHPTPYTIYLWRGAPMRI